MHPAVRPRGLKHLFPVRYAHPANQDATSIFRQRGLRGVEFKARVQLVQLAVFERRAGIVKRPAHPGRRIGVEIAMRLARQPLRAADQDVRPVEGKQVRTLPHIARVRQAVNPVTGDLPAGCPGVQIG